MTPERCYRYKVDWPYVPGALFHIFAHQKLIELSPNHYPIMTNTGFDSIDKVQMEWIAKHHPEAVIEDKSYDLDA